MNTILEKYAQLLVDYCLDLKDGERLFVKSTTLAEPLVREVYRQALRKGVHVVTDLDWREKTRIFFSESRDDQLSWISPLTKGVFSDFEAYLHIRAPFNLSEEQSVDPNKRSIRDNHLKEINQLYYRRTADRSLKRCLCQYPTQAAAQLAGMSLEEYEYFVYNACMLFEDDPGGAWRAVHDMQQKLVDHMDEVSMVRYQAEGTDIRFSVRDRKWMNSDGQTNMPSGEIYSSPVEDSVNGHIAFSYPSIYRGQLVEGIRLWVKDGEVTRWSASTGQSLLDEIFQIEGARQFGEVAIGTNPNIRRSTCNILFDEKMSGTVHMAIGQSYFQTGGKNKSSVHWDMITDMKQGGVIYADDRKIYEDGRFLI